MKIYGFFIDVIYIYIAIDKLKNTSSASSRRMCVARRWVTLARRIFVHNYCCGLIKRIITIILIFFAFTHTLLVTYIDTHTLLLIFVYIVILIFIFISTLGFVFFIVFLFVFTFVIVFVFSFVSIIFLGA